MPDFDDDEPGPRRPVEELQRIARYQRWVIAAALAQLALWAGCLLMSLARSGVRYDLGFPVFLTVAIGCAGGVYAFLLYCTVRDPLTGFAMGAASAVPVMGLLALTVVCGVATRELNRSGVPVGFFGANPDAVEDAEYLGLYEEDAGW